MSKDSLNTEIGNNSLTPSTDVGQGCQIAAVVDGLLCGLVGKTVARLEENCKRL